MSHAKLIDSYLAALPRTVVSGTRNAGDDLARIETDHVPAAASSIARLFSVVRFASRRSKAAIQQSRISESCTDSSSRPRWRYERVSSNST